MVFFELFSNNPDVVTVQAGDALFREGDEGRLMFVLTSGTADVIIGNRVVEVLQHGNIVGELSLVSPAPRSSTVVATTDCQFVAVDEKRFQYLVQQAPFFATQVMRVIAERLRNTNKLVPPIEDI